MKHRSVEWFFKREEESSEPILNLPHYVELYFQLFRDQFSGSTEIEKRMHCLVYIVSSEHKIDILKDVSADKNIRKILDEPAPDAPTTSNNLRLSNFHWYYYKFNKLNLNNQGLIFDAHNPRDLYLWYYTWGLTAIPGNYLHSHMPQLLMESKKYILKDFQVSLLLELLIDDLRFKAGWPEKIDEIALRGILGSILFSYNSRPYTLNETQLEQLSSEGKPSPVFIKMWGSYLHYLGNHHKTMISCYLNIPPNLRQRILNK